MADIKTQRALDDELRTIKVDEDSTPISVSKDKVKIDGKIVDTTHFDNIEIEGTVSSEKLTLNGTKTTYDTTINFGGDELFFVNKGERVVTFKHVAGTIPSFNVHGLNGSTVDFFNLICSTNGATTMSTTDSAGSSADLTVDIDGDIVLDSESGNIIGKSSGSTFTPSASNHLTTKAYVDSIAGGSYQYETKVSNYYTTATANFIPLSGYVIERTTSANYNEFLGFLAPFNGTLESLWFRSEIAQSGNFRVAINEASDGTEIPATVTGRWDETIDIADDTALEMDFTSLTASSGNNVITKGKLYIIKITSPSASNDTNVTTVWKWDVTS